MLSSQELDRGRRFVPPAVRRRFVISHACCRLVLAQHLGVDPQSLVFEQGQFGKPHLPEYPNLSFNMAHSGEYGLLALNTVGEPLGVDLECLRDGSNFEQLSERYFCRQENLVLKHLTGAEFARRFFQFWTRKEAVLKALGTGLRTPLDSFCVPCQELERAQPLAWIASGYPTLEHQPPWHLWELIDQDNCLGSLCLPGSNWQFADNQLLLEPAWTAQIRAFLPRSA